MAVYYQVSYTCLTSMMDSCKNEKYKGCHRRQQKDATQGTILPPGVSQFEVFSSVVIKMGFRGRMQTTE